MLPIGAASFRDAVTATIMPRYGALPRANAIHWRSANPLTFDAARRHALASRNTLGSSLCAKFALSHAAKGEVWRIRALLSGNRAALLLRPHRAKPEARCSRQSGRTSFGRAPQAEQRSRQRSAGTVTAPGRLETSTLARRPQSQVAKIERTPRLRMLARSMAGPSNRRGMRRG
jgi:hypothetical protein